MNWQKVDLDKLAAHHGAVGPLIFREDIPSDEWVASKVATAQESGVNEWGVPKRFGPITGYFSRPLLLPVAVLVTIPGERGEQAAIRHDSLAYIRSHLSSKGILPHGPPFVTIDPFGKAWVNEGNHRIMVARECGLSHLPVEVRYYAGSQRVAGALSPDLLLRYDLAVQEESFMRHQALSMTAPRTLVAPP